MNDEYQISENIPEEKENVNKIAGKLEKSYINYQKILNKGLVHKFTDLENWLYKKSDLLLYESTFPKRTYHKFKRGSIVRVDFGVNIGSEFSLYHFAIVISKNDDIYKDLVTVIPLTSKSHKHNTISINDLIIRNFVKNTVRAISRIELKVNEIKEQKIEILSKLKLYDNIQSEKTVDEQAEYQKLISKLSLITSDEVRYQKEAEELIDIVQIYSKYSEVSHACVSQVKVVSKSRIAKPINKFDIVEKTICSHEMLKKIDMEIIRRYTGIDFPKIESIIDNLYSEE